MYIFEFVFWACVVIVLYVYAGYPLLCYVIASILNRLPARSSHQKSTTIIIAAYNEADQIVSTVHNKLDLVYPVEQLSIVVVSDGSDDGTDDQVAGISDSRVRLLRQEPRAGKTAALNLAVPLARGNIIVFSDANSLYAPTALKNLLAPFADPQVGYVTGRMVYKAPDGSLTGQGCSIYMLYENTLRKWETRLGSIVGVDGGIDAVRRELYEPMRADQLPDFVLPLNVREKGYRVVYEPEALLYEDALADAKGEFRMRVRVTLRALHALKDKAALLNPVKYGLFAWQLFSHKLLRYLAPLFLIVALVANLILAPSSTFWLCLIFLQFVFYLVAGFGHIMRHRHLPRVITLIYYLCLINLAAAVAILRFIRGEKQITWQPRT